MSKTNFGADDTEQIRAQNVVAEATKQGIDMEKWALIGSVLLSLLIVLTTVIYFIKRKSKTNIILVGLSDSGKTLIFTKFISKCKSQVGLKTEPDLAGEWDCFKSIKENCTEIQSRSGEKLKLVDFPGAERLRSQLFESWLGKDLKLLRRLIFVVDSNTVGKKTRDIAELLYDVLASIHSSPVPILVVCNKQDLDMAKSGKAIKSLLEKELGLVCKTRNAMLENTSDSQKSVIPIKSGEFKWEAHGKTVEFIDCTATDDESFELLRSWAT